MQGLGPLERRRRVLALVDLGEGIEQRPQGPRLDAISGAVSRLPDLPPRSSGNRLRCPAHTGLEKQMRTILAISAMVMLFILAALPLCLLTTVN